MEPHQWMQATLAIRCGGLGIQDPVSQRLAARLACITGFVRDGPEILRIESGLDLLPHDATQVITDMHSLLGDVAPLPMWLRHPDTVLTCDEAATDQNWWSQKCHFAVQKTLSTSLPPADAVRFHCQTIPHANAWLAVLPSVPKRQLMSTVEFRCTLRWTLGMGMVPPVIPGMSAHVALQ